MAQCSEGLKFDHSLAFRNTLCLSLNNVAMRWKSVKVVFISKVEKRDRSSFFLDTLEILIEAILDRNSTDRHIYRMS